MNPIGLSPRITAKFVPKSPPTLNLHFDYYSGIPIKEQVLSKKKLNHVNKSILTDY